MPARGGDGGAGQMGSGDDRDRGGLGDRSAGDRSAGDRADRRQRQQRQITTATRVREPAGPEPTQAPAPVDPAPKTADQLASESAARQAEVRRGGRGSTILSGRLGEAAGPSISRRTLGGL